MFMAAKEFPLPIEYRFLPLEEVFHEPPADMADRTVVFLDCGNIDRMPVDFLSDGDNFVINIDHHHDNTRFGDVNLVDIDASCTAEIVYELAGLLGGRDHAGDRLGALRRPGHRHRQVHVREHQRPHAPDRRRPDRSRGRRRRHLPPPLRARADREAAAASRAPSRGSSATATSASSLTYITAADYEATGAGEEMTEGIIDHLRSVEGAKVAALVRDQGDRGRAARKVSLRSSDGDVDVSAIAREHGGGGHKRAAGFSTDLELDELVELPLRRGRRPARRLSDGRAARRLGPALRQAGRDDLARRRRRGCGASAACKAGHAGTLDPFATGLLLVLLGRATRLQRFLHRAAEDLPWRRRGSAGARAPATPTAS